MTEFKLRKQDGNPVGDMDEIIQQAKQRLNTTVENILDISFEDDNDDLIIKIKAR